jgi:Resolvase, N terminal domain
VVTKLGRLGRNAMDVRSTVERLAAMGVKVHCLALGGVDLTSAAGKMTTAVISAVAEFERDLLLEQTKSGIQRAKAQLVFEERGEPANLGFRVAICVQNSGERSGNEVLANAVLVKPAPLDMAKENVAHGVEECPHGHGKIFVEIWLPAGSAVNVHVTMYAPLQLPGTDVFHSGGSGSEHKGHPPRLVARRKR